MADTAVRPRPNFGTFLRSDASAGGDALTYYRRKQYLRKNKTILLQAKAGNLPNIQKPLAVLEVKGEPVLPKLQPEDNIETSVKFQQPSVIEPVEQRFRSLTTRPGLSSMRGQPRLIKSANAHSRRSSWSVGDIALIPPARPKTVATGTVHKVTQQQLPSLSPPSVPPKESTKKLGWESETGSARHEGKKHERAQTEPAIITEHDTSELTTEARLSLSGVDSMTNNSVIKPDDIEELAKAYIYGTSTQRAYNEVGWHNKLPGPLPPPPTAVEVLPDQVSLRFSLKRYDAEPAQWQAIGTAWDYAQTRNCSFHKGPQAISFSSSNRRNQQIPGYSGHIGGGMDEVDDQDVEYKPRVVVRTLQPWHTKVSRTANIPGYTGCVHWRNRQPAHDNMPKPEPASTARVHRLLPVEENSSPFIRTGVLSKTVTLTSPFNPFNKIEN